MAVIPLFGSASSSVAAASHGFLTSGHSSAARRSRRKQCFSARAKVPGSNPSTTTNRNPYSILGVSPGASQSEIKKAYRRLALQFHPDVCKGDSCTTDFIQVGEAYKSIMDSLNDKASSWSTKSDDDNAYEPMMGVNDETWEDWEVWMGWEGAGIRDYSSHINYAL